MRVEKIREGRDANKGRVMTEEQFDTLVVLIRTLALDAVSYSDAYPVPADADVAAAIAQARSELVTEKP